jgi:hypothetical protein
MEDIRQKDFISIEFTEDNLNRFLKEYYSTHRKTKNPIVEESKLISWFNFKKLIFGKHISNDKFICYDNLGYIYLCSLVNIRRNTYSSIYSKIIHI